MRSPSVSSISALVILTLSLSAACTSTTNFGTGYQRTSSSSTGPGQPDTSASTSTTARRDPFDGAPAYAPGLPDERAATTHANAQVGVVPNKDAKCLKCHGAGGDADAPRFVFGGTVYEGRDAMTGAKDLELGVVDANGKEHLVHSDEDGNFWFMGTEALAYPAYAAVRVGTTEKAMKRKINDATDLECNSCHDAANPIVRP